MRTPPYSWHGSRIGTVLCRPRGGPAHGHRGLVTAVSSDFLLFDPYRRCVACDRPAQHWARGVQHHPELAGGVCIEGGGFWRLAVVCGACASPGNLERCLWEARRLAERPSEVCFVYQLVGPLAARQQVHDFVDSLQYHPPGEPNGALPEARLDDLPGA